MVRYVVRLRKGAEQLGLFGATAPVHVKGHVRKRAKGGVSVVAPHERAAHVAAPAPPAPAEPTPAPVVAPPAPTPTPAPDEGAHARAALKAPRAPPSIGNMSKNAEKLVGEVQRLVDDDHEAVRDTEGWLKQHARFDRASRKARSEGWDDLSDWIDAQRRRLAVQREDKRAWRTLARNCPPSMDPVDWAVSLLDRGDPTKMFGILPDEIQQAARQRRSAQSWEPGTRSTNLPYFGRVTVTVHQHSDRKAQRPRNQFSTVVEWTNSQGERAAAEFDPFEQQDRAERFRLKRGTPMPELLQYEVTKLYQGQVPLPPVDPEINEGNKLDWLPYSYQR